MLVNTLVKNYDFRICCICSTCLFDFCPTYTLKDFKNAEKMKIINLLNPEHF